MPDALEEGRRDEAIVARLLRDGVLRKDGARLRTARRWQGAMARAALRLRSVGEDGADLRVPVVHALLDIYPLVAGEELVAVVRLMLDVERGELGRICDPPA